MAKKKLSTVEVAGKKETLLLAAIAMISLGVEIITTHYAQADASRYLGCAFGFALIIVGALILYGRGFLKINHWHPDHVDIVSWKEWKQIKALEKQKKDDIKGVV